MRADRTIVLAGASISVQVRDRVGYPFSEVLSYALPSLQDDDEVVEIALSRNGRNLMYASDRFENDKRIVLATVKNKGLALSYADDELKQDLGFVKEAIKLSPEAIRYASKHVQAKLKVRAPSASAGR
ncbi:DUF4116 domain-containing protein [Candidatus Comchoanobacter bicostacola]|uniref:DUF4116 domain-containing protein n=1 Tax=Candidatus Comchoanobacter bicostacola TaxID=2919598 RepID=A0ABY5DK07_9GAMM|nr:DUF4116 domain-containing protein [Candidatus Comchoanobacter bicostacola]UTC24219.1 DUF4116 domain-containing protein [Candidatus Comchoanobacter bicostacola]